MHMPYCTSCIKAFLPRQDTPHIINHPHRPGHIRFICPRCVAATNTIRRKNGLGTWLPK